MIHHIGDGVVILDDQQDIVRYQVLYNADMVIVRRGNDHYVITKNRHGNRFLKFNSRGLLNYFAGEKQEKVAKALYEFGDIDQETYFLESV